MIKPIVRAESFTITCDRKYTMFNKSQKEWSCLWDSESNGLGHVLVDDEIEIHDTKNNSIQAYKMTVKGLLRI